MTFGTPSRVRAGHHRIKQRTHRNVIFHIALIPVHDTALHASLFLFPSLDRWGMPTSSCHSWRHLQQVSYHCSRRSPAGYLALRTGWCQVQTCCERVPRTKIVIGGMHRSGDMKAVLLMRFGDSERFQSLCSNTAVPPQLFSRGVLCIMRHWRLLLVGRLDTSEWTAAHILI